MTCNLLLIGPSTTGKTTLINAFAKKYKGVAIGLDDQSGLGRPIYSLGAIKEKEFTDEDIGVMIRQKMVQEAEDAIKLGKHFFMDDAFPAIVYYIPKTIKCNIILVLPTIDRMKYNIRKRNEEARSSGDERYIQVILDQFADFIMRRPEQENKEEMKIKKVKKVKEKDKDSCNRCAELKKIHKKPQNSVIWISPQDIHDLMEYDKIFYKSESYVDWEHSLLKALHYFNFSIDHFEKEKSKKIPFIPKNVGQKYTIIVDETYSIEKSMELIEQLC
jgi:hypothetical protein